jgi:hypothetical protein
MIDEQQVKSIKLGNGCTIEMVLKKGAWLGLGRIMAGKTLLRNGARPIALRIDTPEGILYTDYKLEHVDLSSAGSATRSPSRESVPRRRRLVLHASRVKR